MERILQGVIIRFKYTRRLYISGGNLGETEGRSPPKFEVGDGPCIRPPNILRSSVVGCARKYEKSKKGVFVVRKGSCTKGHVRHLTKQSEDPEKSVKIRTTWSMTKKGHEKFLPLKWKFKKNVILVGEKFSRPPQLCARFPPLLYI